MTNTGIALEKLVYPPLNHLRGLQDWEYIIDFSLRESLKLYTQRKTVQNETS